ncbi:glycosyltransferase family 4 protein [Brachybacterium hainanense]|uniref:D-inositol 3-phosphate glycosyltransferase n=1 Tax=Brachybacterium hainanense TaxID=1541174 RepID=A0ABV6RDY0_9MICO
MAARDISPALKVLLTTDWWEPAVNGVVASVSTLRRHLEMLGCEVRVLTLAPGLRSRRRDGVYELGSVSAALVYDQARIGMLSHRRMLREILDWAPDVVHSHCEFSTHVWARRIARDLDVPLVHTYHTIYEDYTHYYSPSRTMGRKAVAAFSRKLLHSTDAVIAPTAKVARLLEGYHVERPVHVIPTGLDLERLRPARTEAERADAAELRRRLRIGPGDTVLLSVCRLAKEKNVDEVIDHLAAADRPGAVLVIVGDGPYRAELEAKVARLGIGAQVRFVGVVDPAEVSRWYRIGDVFVSASQSETQGLTFIEALACGVPLLCRRDPSLDAVVVEGVTGFCFEDAAGFAAGLDRLLSSSALRATMSAGALEHARRTCGADAFARSVEDVYRGVIARRADARYMSAALTAVGAMDRSLAMSA